MKDLVVSDEKSAESSHVVYDEDVQDGDKSEPVAGQLSYEEAAAGGLGRHLGLWSTTFLIIGRIIGTGIFSTPSSIISSVGSVGASFIVWLVGALLAFSGLSVWMELGCMIPRSGGEKVYLEAAYKRPKLFATVVYAFQFIILGFTASNCIIFTEYIFQAANKSASEWEKRGVAIIVITIICLIHAVTPHAGVRGMNIFVLIKIVTLTFIVVTGWVVLGGGTRVKDPYANFRNSFRGTSNSGFEWATALFKVINSYTGWSNACYVLNEVRNPVRTLKIAGPLGLGICTVFYMLANVAYYAAVTPEQVSDSGQIVAGVFMDAIFGEAGLQAISVLVALSALGNVMSVTFAEARVNQELAKEGVVPFSKFWSSSWPFGAPSAALLLHWIPSFIIIVAIPFGDAYNFILDVEGYPMSVVSLFVVIGLFWLRHSQPNLKRPFRCWLPVAIFFAAGQAFLIVAPFLRPPGGIGDTPPIPYWLYSVVGICILLTGAVYWLFWIKILPAIGRYRLQPVHESLADGTAVVVYKKTE